jgi:hypothetical protein
LYNQSGLLGHLYKSRKNSGWKLIVEICDFFAGKRKGAKEYKKIILFLRRKKIEDFQQCEVTAILPRMHE